MNVNKIEILDDLTGVTANQLMAFLQTVMQFVCLEAEFDYDDDSTTDTPEWFNTFRCEMPFQITLPATNAHFRYVQLVNDSNCQSTVTNLLKAQLTEGDMVGVIDDVLWATEMRNYIQIPLIGSAGNLIMQIGQANSTENSNYDPFATADAKVYFGKDQVQYYRNLIESAKAKRQMGYGSPGA